MELPCETVDTFHRNCEGGIVEQIDQAYQFVIRNIRMGSEIVGTGRRDKYELPLSTIREAICNAVFHRDYLEPSSVYVALYDDRLEVLSPGELVKGITLEDAKNGFSKLRNHSLGLVLEYMKEVEGWCGGILRYFTACEDMGLPKPFVGEEVGFFKVVFYRRKANEPISEPINVVLMQMIRDEPGIAKPQLVVKVGKSRATVTRALAALRKKGNIEYHGSKKTGGYYLNKAKNSVSSMDSPASARSRKFDYPLTMFVPQNKFSEVAALLPRPVVLMAGG